MGLFNNLAGFRMAATIQQEREAHKEEHKHDEVLIERETDDYLDTFVSTTKKKPVEKEEPAEKEPTEAEVQPEDNFFLRLSHQE